MKTIEEPMLHADPVISEVRRIKREILQEHNGDIESLFAGLRERQAKNSQLVKTKEGGGDAGLLH